MAQPLRVLLVEDNAGDAELLLRELRRAGFTFHVAVLPITVAALATTPWIARHLSVPAG